MIEMDAVSMQQMMRTIGRAKENIVIYYRLPEGFRNNTASRWVTWADNQPAIRLGYMEAGWTPLPQYGRVNGLDDHGEATPAADGWSWVPILRTEAGRSEFPASQVLTYRWYHANLLPAPFRGKRLHFPQLEAAIAGGLEVSEYECPECSDRFFFEPYALAAHLRNTHEYDRTEIIALGKEVGINFQKTLQRLVQPVSSLTLDDVAATAEPVPVADAESALTINRVRPASTRGAGLAAEDDMLGMMAKELAALKAELAAVKSATGQPMQEMPKAPRPKRQMSEEAKVAARAALEKARQVKVQRSMEAQAHALTAQMQTAPIQDVAD